MRIIDDKGRLFGWINIIDFMVIMFVLMCVISMGYYGWKLFTASKKEVTYEEKPFFITQKEYNELKQIKSQVDNFLKNHPRAKRYFNEIP